MNQWYYQVGGDVLGPVSLEELKRKAAGGEIEREAKPVAPNYPLIIGIGHDPDGNTLEFIQR